jgi:hypothetical protein
MNSVLPLELTVSEELSEGKQIANERTEDDQVVEVV